MRLSSTSFLLAAAVVFAVASITNADKVLRDDDLDAEVELEPNEVVEVDDVDDDADDGSDSRLFQSSPDADVSILFTKPYLTVDDPIGEFLTCVWHTC